MKLCKIVFDYEIEDAAKAFCIAEMCMAYLHTLMSVCLIRVGVMEYVTTLQMGGEIDPWQWVLFITYLTFMIGLPVQGICGVLMYIIGFRKKVIIIFEIWTIVALINFTIPLILLFVGIFATHDIAGADENGGGIPGSVGWLKLYLLYIDIGLGTVGGYVSHLKKQKASPEVVEEDPSGVDVVLSDPAVQDV